jgi:hypothetical protein
MTNENSGNLSAGEISAIVIGSVSAVLIVIGALYYSYKKLRVRATSALPFQRTRVVFEACPEHDPFDATPLIRLSVNARS